jgi:hypothetical protein
MHRRCPHAPGSANDTASRRGGYRMSRSDHPRGLTPLLLEPDHGRSLTSEPVPSRGGASPARGAMRSHVHRDAKSPRGSEVPGSACPGPAVAAFRLTVGSQTLQAASSSMRRRSDGIPADGVSPENHEVEWFPRRSYWSALGQQSKESTDSTAGAAAAFPRTCGVGRWRLPRGGSQPGVGSQADTDPRMRVPRHRHRPVQLRVGLQQQRRKRPNHPNRD